MKKIIPKKNEDFYDFCKIKNLSHLKSCNCTKNIFDKFYLKSLRKEMKYVKDNKISENIAKIRLSNLKNNVYQKVLDYCKSNNVICPHEYQEVNNSLKLFSEKYDMNDPRAFTIIRSVISIQLTAFRMERESNTNNITYLNNKNETVINPIEDIKLKYNNAKINAISVLDKIFEGNKNVNVNIIADVVDIDDVLNLNS